MLVKYLSSCCSQHITARENTSLTHLRALMCLTFHNQRKKCLANDQEVLSMLWLLFFYLICSTFPTLSNTVDIRALCHEETNREPVFWAHAASDILPAPGRTESGRVVLFRTSKPHSIAVHSNTSYPRTASDAPSEQLLQSSSVTSLGTRAIVRPIGAHSATGEDRCSEAEHYLLSKWMFTNYLSKLQRL